MGELFEKLRKRREAVDEGGLHFESKPSEHTTDCRYSLSNGGRGCALESLPSVQTAVGRTEAPGVSGKAGAAVNRRSTDGMTRKTTDFRSAIERQRAHVDGEGETFGGVTPRPEQAPVAPVNPDDDRFARLEAERRRRAEVASQKAAEAEIAKKKTDGRDADEVQKKAVEAVAEEAEARVREEAEQWAREDAGAKAGRDIDGTARQQTEDKDSDEAEATQEAKEEIERSTIEEAEARAKEDADAKVGQEARGEAEDKTKEEVATRHKQESPGKGSEEAERTAGEESQGGFLEDSSSSISSSPSRASLGAQDLVAEEGQVTLLGNRVNWRVSLRSFPSVQEFESPAFQLGDYGPVHLRLRAAGANRACCALSLHAAGPRPPGIRAKLWVSKGWAKGKADKEWRDGDDLLSSFNVSLAGRASVLCGIAYHMP